MLSKTQKAVFALAFLNYLEQNVPSSQLFPEPSLSEQEVQEIFAFLREKLQPQKSNMELCADDGIREQVLQRLRETFFFNINSYVVVASVRWLSEQVLWFDGSWQANVGIRGVAFLDDHQRVQSLLLDGSTVMMLIRTFLEKPQR